MSLRECAPSEREDINTPQFYEEEHKFLTHCKNIDHEIYYIIDEHRSKQECRYCWRAGWVDKDPIVHTERPMEECIKDAQILFLKA